MRYLIPLSLLLLAVCACQKPSYRADFTLETGGKNYDFSVSVAGGLLYLDVRRDGRQLGGVNGSSVPGGKVQRVEATDLNSDGKPEVYVFFEDQSWPGFTAAACGETECNMIGMEGGAGGPRPEDYCGGDSYAFEKGELVRRYKACPPGTSAAVVRSLRYTLKENSFGPIFMERRPAAVGAWRVTLAH